MVPTDRPPRNAEATLVVGSLAPETNADAMSALARAAAPAVEVRLDAFREAPDFRALRAAAGGALAIATLRSEREGGTFAGGESELRRTLGSALDAGFDLVDVERFGPGGADLLGFDPARVALSFHDQAGVPADLASRLAEMRTSRARFLKVVARCRDSRDALSLLALQASVGDERVALFGMGEAGLATRALAPYFGAALSYGALVPGRETASGQPAAEDLRDVYGVGRRRAISRVYALFGGVVSHSFSPALHNAAFEARADDALYVPFALSSLLGEFDPLVAGLDALRLPLRGASVTIPFKEEAGTVAVYRGESVANTLVRSGDSFVASNTDRIALASFVPPTLGGRRALVLGAGGTARTAVEVLASRRYEVFVASRNPVRAHELAEETGATFLPRLTGEEAPFDVLVNATPVGMKAEDGLPCPERLLHHGLVVVDAPYRAGGTALAREARRLGARVFDGFAFLLSQAAGQAELFTGRPTSAEELLSRLPARLRERISGAGSEPGGPSRSER